MEPVVYRPYQDPNDRGLLLRCVACHHALPGPVQDSQLIHCTCQGCGALLFREGGRLSPEEVQPRPRAD